MLHAVEEFLLLRFLCDSKKMKPAVGPGPDGFTPARGKTETTCPPGKSLFYIQRGIFCPSTGDNLPNPVRHKLNRQRREDDAEEAAEDVVAGLTDDSAHARGGKE